MRNFAALLAVATALSTGVEAISNVTRAGRYLYNSDGSRFYIKGVAYQAQGAVIPSADNAFLEPSTFIDPLADGSGCTRDLPFLQQLGVNTIRVYSVNSSLNHDSCMQTFSAAGIYTVIDLSLPTNGSIDRTSPSWSTNLLDLYIDSINAFSTYDNVLAFNVGNEVINGTDNTEVAAYVKAAARDVRSYLTSKSMNTLIGYAAIDGSNDWRDPLANYLGCDVSGDNSDATAIDLYGLNNYEWCGDSTFQDSYAGVEGAFAGLNIPAYFSEFGCITSPPRLWTEVAALFSTDMSPVWSGGIAFSYFPAESAQGEFGMVTISSDGSSVTTSDDFTRLAAQYGNATGPNSPSQSSAGTTSYPSCPSQNSTFLASTTLPPTPNDAACNCLESTLTCRFTPHTANYTDIVGVLIDTACGLLGQNQGNCDAIGGNGSSGVYGAVSGCDPTIKLSFVMSQYYEATGRQTTSCDFAGNATVNPNSPTTASAANSAASSCLSSASATFTPTSPSSGSSSGSGSSGSSSSGSSSSGSSGSANGAVGVFAESKAMFGMVTLVVVGMASAMWTLA